jgi:CheY-like chemotaxis protein
MGRRILMDAGYEVITVNNGSAALKKVHENPPDLIVLDVYMPGYGGLEVCQRLKESRETMKIPVLLTVGKMEPFKTDEAKRVRADAHIIKPFDAGELLAALTKLEDRIVPQLEKRGKQGTKKSRGRPAEEVEHPEVPPDWSEKIAYLAEVKKRNEEKGPSEQPAEQQELPVAAAETFVERIEAVTAQMEAVATAAAKEERAAISDNAVAPVPEAASAAEGKVDEQAAETVSTTPVEQAQPVESQAVPSEVVSEPEQPAASPEASEPSPEFAVQSEPHAEVEDEPVAAWPELAPEIEAISPSGADVATVQPEPAPATAEVIPEPVVESVAAPNASSRTRWIAESVAVSAEEAALALDQEMLQAEGTALAAQAGTTETNTDCDPSADQLEPEDISKGAAFAAAASASVGAVADTSAFMASARDGVSRAEDSEEVSVPSQAVAAWENWQQIRDSVMAPQAAEAIAESVVQVAQASLTSVVEESPNPPVEMSKEKEAKPAPAMESAVLASIVDSVLAELKPRLMEEIAKKLAK